MATARVRLEPLEVRHAEELAPLLDDPRLHEFIGGRPLRLEELRRRYQRQVVGRSSDGHQRWLNWVVRELEEFRAIGLVQATVTSSPSYQAELAWTIAVDFQGFGYARDATAAVAAWLTKQGVEMLVANVRPEHIASGRVAHAIGLRPTSQMVGGEVQWSNQAPLTRSARELISPPSCRQSGSGRPDTASRRGGSKALAPVKISASDSRQAADGPRLRVRGSQ